MPQTLPSVGGGGSLPAGQAAKSRSSGGGGGLATTTKLPPMVSQMSVTQAAGGPGNDVTASSGGRLVTKGVGGGSSAAGGLGGPGGGRRGKSPLVRGRYEAGVLAKLEALHRDGYARKHTSLPAGARPLELAVWRDTVPEPAGKHVSQRTTVGVNMVHPPMARADQDHAK